MPTPFSAAGKAIARKALKKAGSGEPSDITTVEQVNALPDFAGKELDKICPRVKVDGKPVFIKDGVRWVADGHNPTVGFAYAVCSELNSDSGIRISHKLVAQMALAAGSDAKKTKLSKDDIELLVTSGEDGASSSEFKAVCKKYPAVNAVLQSLF